MTCTRPPRGRLWEIQTHRPPACAHSPSPAPLSLPLSTALLASSPLQSFRPTHPRSWGLYLARWDLVKHHAVFWPQGKGSYCPHHDSRRERLVQGGAAGPSGAPVGLVPAFTSPAVSFSSLPSFFHPALLFSLAVFSPSPAQNLRMKRNLKSHLNLCFSWCGPQTSNRAITRHLLEMQSPELHPRPPESECALKQEIPPVICMQS